jgi:tRNA(fMet)-specific endonuclease VapC
MYLLDTNTCIRYLNGRSPGVVSRLRSLPPAEIAVCSVVKAELYFGSLRSTDPDQILAAQQRFLNQFTSFPFDDKAAPVYARIRSDLTARGQLIGPYDMMIAAIAIANGLILVTHNTDEFGRIAELPVEEWELL